MINIFDQLFNEAINISTARATISNDIKSKAYKQIFPELFKDSDRIILPDKIKIGNLDQTIPKSQDFNRLNMTIEYLGFTTLTTSDYQQNKCYMMISDDFEDMKRLNWPLYVNSSDYLGVVKQFKNRQIWPKQVFKIGKVLQSFIKFLENNPTDFRYKQLNYYREAHRRFEKDPTRNLKDFENKVYRIVISRHPYDILGMSTDRMWTSCTNIGDYKGIVYKKDTHEGEHADTILPFIHRQGMIAYLIPDTEIMDNNKCKLQKPISRLNLVPHFNYYEEVAYGIGPMYGIQVVDFHDTVKNFILNNINTNINNRTYYKIPWDIYNDKPEAVGFKQTTNNENI